MLHSNSTASMPSPALPKMDPAAAASGLLDDLYRKAAMHPRHIVLCEGDDARVLHAAIHAQQSGLAHITLIGNPSDIQYTAQQAQLRLDGVVVIDPENSDLAEPLANALYSLREHKGMTLEHAKDVVKLPLMFANLMVAEGLADGSVAGAVHTTADVVRTAIQTIGPAPGTSLVSSFFLMVLGMAHHPDQHGLIFTDCGLVIDPSAQELAQIAVAGAQSAEQLLGEAPRVAMLSFSTSGSADHPKVSKMQEATALIRASHPELAIDGELQLDAALVPAISSRKMADSRIAGRANVLVFPDLNAGNIGYKLAERLGGAQAVGPLLQGLRKPANDLSRGCSSSDVLNVIAVTALQCG